VCFRSLRHRLSPKSQVGHLANTPTVHETPPRRFHLTAVGRNSPHGLTRRNSTIVLQVVAVFFACFALSFIGAMLHAGAQSMRNPFHAINSTGPEQRRKPADHTTSSLLGEHASGNAPQAPAPENPKLQVESAVQPVARNEESVDDPPKAKFPGRRSVTPSASPSLFAAGVPPSALAQVPATASLPSKDVRQNDDSAAQPKAQVPGQSPERVRAPQGTPTQTSELAGVSHAAQEQPVPEQRAKVVTVPVNSSIAVRLAETLSSDRNRTGDTFRATLASPLIANGALVARTDATVLGRVENARRAPLLGGQADITLSLSHISGAEGELLAVNTTTVEEQGSHLSIVNTAKMATGAVVGAVVGAVKGAGEGSGLSSSLSGGDSTHGFMATNRTVVLPAGTQFVFRLNAPVTVPRKVD
jgi:hypothetical protein